MSSPYSRELQEMLTVEKERSVLLPHGGVGYILGNMVIAPFFYKGSCISTKDGHDIVLEFVGTSKWGVSYFNLPFGIPCETLRFRKEHIHTDTYFFKVSDEIRLCRGSAISQKEGRFEINTPDQFCPIFDRHAHLLGFSIGLLHNTLVCVTINEILAM